MKPSARKRVERQITELMRRDGDRCSSCKAPFPHNSRTFGGVTVGGDAALVGECCQGKLKEMVLSGLYVDQRYKDMPLRQTGEMPQPRAPFEVAEAIDAMQRSFRRIDQATDTIKAKGGIAAKNMRLNTSDSLWKDDDARWFAANQTRTHRLRSAFPGELEGLPHSTEPIPPGHEFQMLVRQVQPGTRLRIAFCRNLEVPIPDIEPLLHATFDMVSASEGGVLSTGDVADLALKYAAAAEGGKPRN
jgi:hypothetical protein